MNEISTGSIERFIAEAKARKIQPSNFQAFFFDYFDIVSLDELTTKELQLVNKKVAQYRLPTVDGSDVFLAEETNQNDLLTRKTGN